MISHGCTRIERLQSVFIRPIRVHPWLKDSSAAEGVCRLSTIFARIISGELPAAIVYQDDLVTAFRDIQPLAPVHILIVPNKVCLLYTSRCV